MVGEGNGEERIRRGVMWERGERGYGREGWRRIECGEERWERKGEDWESRHAGRKDGGGRKGEKGV